MYPINNPKTHNGKYLKANELKDNTGLSMTFREKTKKIMIWSSRVQSIS